MTDVATDPQQSTTQPISFDDLGGKRVASGAPPAAPSKGLDFSDLGGKPVSTTPPPSDATSPSDDSVEPEQPGFWQRAYETSGIKGLIDSAKQSSDEDEAMANSVKEHMGNGRYADAAEALLHHIGKRAGQALLGPGGELIKGQAENTYQKGKQAVQDVGKGDYAGAVADAAEAVPVVGPVAGAIAEPAAKDIKDKNWAGVAGDVVGGAGQLLSMKGAPDNLEAAADAGASAEAAIPNNPKIAGTELPRTVGQAASDANPAGIGADVKGVEDIARKIPGSGKLRDISTEQQAGAREVLADKSKAATGAEVSAAPESIEQNAANAADAARQAGSAKYEGIGKAAKDADLSKPVEAAHSILTDDTLAKVLPKGARDALNKVASSMSEREEIAQQIYGKPFSDLEAAKQAEVGKAMSSNPEATAGFDAVLKARSELGSAANSARDAADARLLHQAHDLFSESTAQSIADLDKANGTTHGASLAEADKLWSQKYAFETFRDGLQDIMQKEPHTGHREISGSGFQQLINRLDPHGAKGKTILQRMFPDDAQSLKDLHDLADFLGKNQGSAGSGGGGGIASGMAKLRILGVKESALGLIANTAGFSWLLSKPGLARNMLAALTAGKNVAKASAAIGAINHAASQVQQKADDSDAVPEGRIPVQAPDGNTYHFPDEESANRFKQAANIQ